ncbi:MAG: aldehyde dehydrogenase family protein [Crocinitomicaceae bacterium]|nr:aldehyde dehydrogenase family protein [Crocinitomicaceae bacterium]
MKIINPYNKKELGSVELVDLSGALNKVKSAKNAEPAMRKLSAFQKSTILNQIVDGINKRFEEFVLTIARESGKPYLYAKGEVQRAIETFTIAAEECKRIPHESFDLDASARGKGRRGEYRYFPAGVVFGISPFNFPLNLAVHKIAPAIAAGCPIVLKPSSKTPLTMELLNSVIAESDLPEGGFTLLHCSREVGNEIIQHPDINVLSFTGSPTIGWEMKAKAGKKKVVLELGGNAAAIVCKDANYGLALDELTVGAFAYSGQVCIHTQRIYLHQELVDQFKKDFVSRAQQLTVGDPSSPSTNFSVMIDEQNAKRIESWVNEATAAGAQLLLGGNREGAYYSPTILTNVPKEAKVRNEEVFGPVVIVESFESLQEAIEEVNDSRWGLQASIFTDSIIQLNQAFDELEVGGVIHNLSTTFRVDEMPYGGVKDSGFGREGVKYAMMDYLEGKLLIR